MDRRRVNVFKSLFLAPELKERILLTWETFTEDEKEKFNVLIQKERHYIFQSLEKHPNKEMFSKELKQVVQMGYRKINEKKEKKDQEGEEDILHHLESVMKLGFQEKEKEEGSLPKEKKPFFTYKKAILILFLLFIFLIGGYFLMPYILTY